MSDTTPIEAMCKILKKNLIVADEYTDCVIVYKVTFDQLRNLYDQGRSAILADREKQAARVPEGYALVSIEQLTAWKNRVNTLATLSLKAERYEVGRELKTEIADVIAVPVPPKLAAALESTERLAGGGEPVAEVFTMESLHPSRLTHHVSLKKVLPAGTKLYTTPPPQAERLPLSDEEIGAMLINDNTFEGSLFDFARAIESAHGIGTPKEST